MKNKLFITLLLLVSFQAMGASVIIDMCEESRLPEQGERLRQADEIKIRNATADDFPDLLPYMERVTQLTVKINGFAPSRSKIAQAIANSPRMVNLTKLDLSDNQIGDAGATAIAKSQHIANLTTLALSWNNIGPAAVAAVKQRFPFATF